MGKRAVRKGEPWTEAEVALVMLCKDSDEGKAILAELFGRTVDAVDFAYSWKEGHNMPKSAGNRIIKHLEVIRKTKLHEFEDGIEIE